MSSIALKNGWFTILKALGSKAPTIAVTGGSTSITAALVHRVKVSLEDVAVTMTDATTAGSHGSAVIASLPENVTVIGAELDIDVARVGTAIAATAAVVSSVGTATVGVDNATLTAAEADLVASTAATLTAGAGSATAAAAVYKSLAVDSTVKLNFAIPDAGSTGNDTLTVNGTVTLVYIKS